MSRKPEKIIISDHEYEIGFFGVEDGLDLKLRLEDILFPIAMASKANINPETLKRIEEAKKQAIVTGEKVDYTQFTDESSSNSSLALVKAFSSIPVKERLSLVKDLLGCVRYKNSPIMDIFNVHFMHRLDDVFELAGKVIQVNGFLDLSQGMGMMKVLNLQANM